MTLSKKISILISVLAILMVTLGFAVGCGQQPPQDPEQPSSTETTETNAAVEEGYLYDAGLN